MLQPGRRRRSWRIRQIKSPMPKYFRSHPFLNPRILAAGCLCLIATWLGLLSFAAPSSGAKNAANLSAGSAVVPSEFRGDVRDLPQTITDAERKNFIRPLELDYPVPAIKQLLPGATAEGQSILQSSDLAAAAMGQMPTPISSFDAMNYNANAG